MKAYSLDLRTRIVAAVENDDLTQAEVAEQFAVSESFVEKLLHRWRTTNDLSARRGQPGPKRVLAPFGDQLRALLQAQPDLTLDEISERLLHDHQLRANHSMVSRELQRLNLPLKKSRSTPASATRPASKRSARRSARNWLVKRSSG
jgi:transposase